MKHTVRSDAGEITIRDDGVIYAHVFPNAHIGLKEAHEYHSMVEYLTRSQPHVSLIDMTGIGCLEDEARIFLLSNSSTWGKTLALGLIARTGEAKNVCKRVLTENPPTYLVQIFSSPIVARQWAERIIQENSTVASL